MFTVDDATASAIRAAFERGGEMLGIAELRQHYRGIPDNERARVCLRILLGWSMPSTGQEGMPAASRARAAHNGLRKHRQAGSSNEI